MCFRVSRRTKQLYVIDLMSVGAGDSRARQGVTDTRSEIGQRVEIIERELLAVIVDEKEPVAAPRNVAGHRSKHGHDDRHAREVPVARHVGDLDFAVLTRLHVLAEVGVEVEVVAEVVVGESEHGPVGRVLHALDLEAHQLLHRAVAVGGEVHLLGARQQLGETAREHLAVLHAEAPHVAVAQHCDARLPGRLRERKLGAPLAVRVAHDARVEVARQHVAGVEPGTADPADLGLVAVQHAARERGVAGAGHAHHHLAERQRRDPARQREQRLPHASATGSSSSARRRWW